MLSSTCSWRSLWKWLLGIYLQVSIGSKERHAFPCAMHFTYTIHTSCVQGVGHMLLHCSNMNRIVHRRIARCLYTKMCPMATNLAKKVSIVYDSFSFVTKYRTDHFTVVLFGAGGVTTSSRYRQLEFSPTNINSTFFLYTLVTFTFWSPPSYNDIKKLWLVPLSTSCVRDGLPAIPSATGLIPLPGHKTQHSDPACSSSCVHGDHTNYIEGGQLHDLDAFIFV